MSEPVGPPSASPGLASSGGIPWRLVLRREWGLLVLALALGETIWPDVWWPIVALTVSGHLIGQGLLVYALRHFSALVIGLALLTQPAISSVIGWLVYGEALGPLDVLGMVLLAAALVIVRASDRV